jgi:hypothetical protein
VNYLAQRHSLEWIIPCNWQKVVFHEDPCIRGIPWVSGDVVSSAHSLFLVFPGGVPFFIRREPFDPNCGGSGFLWPFCYTRKVRERWVFHVLWRKVLTCRVIGRKLWGLTTPINFLRQNTPNQRHIPPDRHCRVVKINGSSFSLPISSSCPRRFSSAPRPTSFYAIWTRRFHG